MGSESNTYQAFRTALLLTAPTNRPVDSADIKRLRTYGPTQQDS